MSFAGPSFVIAIIAISTLGWMFITWVRARHGYPVENERSGTVHRTDPDAGRKIDLLSAENEKLTGRKGRTGGTHRRAGEDRHRSHRPHRPRKRRAALTVRKGSKEYESV